MIIGSTHIVRPQGALQLFFCTLKFLAFLMQTLPVTHDMGGSLFLSRLPESAISRRLVGVEWGALSSQEFLIDRHRSHVSEKFERN